MLRLIGNDSEYVACIYAEQNKLMSQILSDKDKYPKKIALYGGTFDPVHNAHIEIAERALKTLGLDLVYFIPNAQSPHKVKAPQANNQQRLKMLEIALNGKSNCIIEDYEIKQGGLSYSVKTARYFGEKFPQTEIFWILGADQFVELDNWRDIEILCEQVTFAVFNRPGTLLYSPPVRNLRFVEVGSQPMNVKSSEIRSFVEAGSSIASYLPSRLEAFILSEGLYKHSL
jgi:nicotinate-nucleotide adenylyltransferase